MNETSGLEGGCSCKAVRYRMACKPIFVNCCHCSWCQRESGSAFAVNALIEADHLQILSGETEEVLTPSLSGKGQAVMRCPHCKLALWSHYLGGGRLLAFVRVGTLDDPSRVPPDAHIYTSSKQPWVVLPAGTPSFSEQYVVKELWPAESLQRVKAARAAANK